MSTEKKLYRFLFAGGGTGGHLFPAVAVAEKIRSSIPEAEILFIGTKTRIEGKVIPKLGFKFKSIWIKGFTRKLTLENLLFPLKLFVSIVQSIVINMNFKPQVAIGSGGYVSGPAVFTANFFGAKIILLEQNSYPGVTTRLLQKYADEIHISFEDSKKYFKNKDKVFLTGNPVRENKETINKKNALERFGFTSSKKTLLVLGGSLGAASLNKAISKIVDNLTKQEIQIIWQTGSIYYQEYKNFAGENVWINSFIDDMNMAYAACDLLISRAGATTLAEITNLGIPSILIPSPNVSENHQYFNAKSLSDKNAAVLIEDKNIESRLLEEIISLIKNDIGLAELKRNSFSLRKANAASVIAERAIKFAKAV